MFEVSVYRRLPARYAACRPARTTSLGLEAKVGDRAKLRTVFFSGFEGNNRFARLLITGPEPNGSWRLAFDDGQPGRFNASVASRVRPSRFPGRLRAPNMLYGCSFCQCLSVESRENEVLQQILLSFWIIGCT